MQRRGGFTLVEMIISLGVSVILFGAAIIISLNFIKNRQLSVVVETTVSYLRAAEQRALASEGNMSHGVRLSGGSLTMFRGASYAARQTAYDTVLPYSPYITVSGVSDVVFAKQTGAPSATGNLTISNGIRSATIIIYSTGAISQ
jgi:prepilin-type N-terminal cleavage/methylation domain-containing protein